MLIDSLEIESLDDSKKHALRNLGANDFHALLRKYDCDFYFVIDAENDPSYLNRDEWLKNKQYWYSWWQHDRDGIEKGFIQLEVRGGVIQ